MARLVQRSACLNALAIEFMVSPVPTHKSCCALQLKPAHAATDKAVLNENTGACALSELAENMGAKTKTRPALKLCPMCSIWLLTCALTLAQNKNML